MPFARSDVECHDPVEVRRVDAAIRCQEQLEQRNSRALLPLTDIETRVTPPGLSLVVQRRSIRRRPKGRHPLTIGQVQTRWADMRARPP